MNKEQRDKKQTLIQRRALLCILTLGCPKNIADSENIANSLANSFELTENVNIADVILLNTCGFIKSAINETLEYIEKISNLKKDKPELKIIVYGCAVSRLMNENFDFKAKFPLVDKFVTLNQASNYLHLLNSLCMFAFEAENSVFTMSLKKAGVSISQNTGFLENNLPKTPPSAGLVAVPTAYVKISDGCNRKCTFCTIPSIKGSYVSVPKGVIIEQVKRHIASGKKEIILIGQETTNYGIDIESSLYELVDELSLIDGLKWLRIMYAHPITFDLKILELMNSRESICKYIDIPLQHIDNETLTAMGRAGNQAHILKLIDTMRKVVPNIAIRSTFITGFPGETPRQHKELLNFLKNAKLERVGIFKYSRENGTPAASLPAQIKEIDKEKRFDALMLLQRDISLELNRQKIGHTISVLIEADYDKEYFIGRSEFDAPDIDCDVFIKKHKSIKIGDIVDCYIFDAEHYSLFGHCTLP